jgi:hypothetical protein
MDKELLKKYLQDKDTVRCGWGVDYIDTSFETMPSEFISFAENDLQSNFDHKYINALSNAKRALDCQADRLLKLFGYYQLSQDKFWGFPKKLDLIQKFEIIAPRVLNKINKSRNLMEHQYVKPKPDQVEDFLDIASLFIASTDHYVSHFVRLVQYINEVNEEFNDLMEVDIELDNINSKLIVKTKILKSNQESVDFSIDKSDEDFVEIFKSHLKKIEYR